MRPTILITGVCGFILNNFVRHIIDKYPQYRFVGVDKIVSSYNLNNIFEHENYKFYMGDISDEVFVNNVFAIERPDFVINGAAESYVCDSIKSAVPFVRSNILGVQVLVDASLKYGIEKFVQVSTDECYGQIPRDEKRSWTEKDVCYPRNPYSATKYAAEVLIYAANQTHNLKYNITRASNTYGKFQPPRNLVPRCAVSIINNKSIPIHGDGLNIREWIHCFDHCDAIMTVLENGVANNVYNVGTGFELTNMEMVNRIADILGKKPIIEYIEDRKGHDQKYAINCNKIKKLGWAPKIKFDDGLKDCVEWYIENKWRYQE